MVAALVIGYLLIGIVVGLVLYLIDGEIDDFTDATLVGLGVFFVMWVWPIVLFILLLGGVATLVSERLR